MTADMIYRRIQSHTARAEWTLRQVCVENELEPSEEQVQAEWTEEVYKASKISR